jgi:kynurenine formamidase
MADGYSPGWDADSVRDFEELIRPLSNWGRWGADDEAGTMNLLTAETARLAALEVRTGEVVPLGRPLVAAKAGDPRGLIHHMLSSGEGAQPLGGRHAVEWLGFAFHGFTVSHLDAPSHQLWGDRTYNDRPSDVVTTRSGAGAASVLPFARGLVGRGVLLDAGRTFGDGADWLEPGTALGSAELDAMAAGAGVAVRPGDFVLVRTGRDARESARGPIDFAAQGCAGLAAEALRWLRHHDVAVLGSDTASDVMQPGGVRHPMQVHAGALAFLGLPLLDNLWLDDLATRCAELGRWTFQLVVAPLAITHGTGSPVNPTAVL